MTEETSPQHTHLFIITQFVLQCQIYMLSAKPGVVSDTHGLLRASRSRNANQRALVVAEETSLEHVEQADLIRFRQLSKKSQIAHQIYYRFAGFGSLSEIVLG